MSLSNFNVDELQKIAAQAGQDFIGFDQYKRAIFKCEKCQSVYSLPVGTIVRKFVRYVREHHKHI